MARYRCDKCGNPEWYDLEVNGVLCPSCGYNFTREAYVHIRKTGIDAIDTAIASAIDCLFAGLDGGKTPFVDLEAIEITADAFAFAIISTLERSPEIAEVLVDTRDNREKRWIRSVDELADAYYKLLAKRGGGSGGRRKGLAEGGGS